MGMFDYLKCHYPLPVEGANDLDFQTKSTSAQLLDNYEIRADGTLWHEQYDVEDHGDKNANGIERLIGCMTRVNEHWVTEKMTGEIVFYATKPGNHTDDCWVTFSSYFVDGKLRELHLIVNID